MTEESRGVTWSRVLKFAISAGVFGASAIGRFLIRVVGRIPKGSCVVLYYHSVPAEQRAQFARQLDLLLRLARPIAVNGRVTLEPGVHYAGVTFDDGFENYVEQAVPELAKRKIPSTVFIISDALGKAFGRAGSSEKVMSEVQLRALAEDLVIVGSHTVTHPMLPSIDEAHAAREIVRSRAQIEELLGRKVLLFSFPFGGFNARLIELCRDAGYQRIFTTLPDFAFKDPGEFVVGRVRVDPTDWPLEFRFKLSGSYGWLPQAFALKRAIVSNALFRRIRGAKSARAKSAPQSMIHESGGQ